jgi:hypothetical protein
VGPVAVAGDIAAYGLTQFGVDTVAANVVVRRLTDNRLVRSMPATSAPLRPEFVQSVGSLVVKGDGAVAWIATAGSIIGEQVQETEVHRADARGVVLLSSGQPSAAIDPASLRLRRSTVMWAQAGRSRSATLR